MKRHKGIIIILIIVVLARVPIPGKAGQAASLISRAVLSGYEKTICSNSHSLVEQTARQVALGVSCPDDKFQFPLSVMHNMLQQIAPSAEQKESAKSKSHHAHDHKVPIAVANQASLAGAAGQ